MPLFHHNHHHDLKDPPHYDHHLKISDCVTTATSLPVKRMIKMLTIIRRLLISLMLDDIRLDRIESSIWEKWWLLSIMTFLIFSQISFQTTTKTSHFSLNLFSTRITCFGARALITYCCIQNKTKVRKVGFHFRKWKQNSVQLVDYKRSLFGKKSSTTLNTTWCL